MSDKELTQREFARAQAVIYEMCGIRISDKKRTLLTNRMRRRLRHSGVSDFSTYLNQIEENPNGCEVTELLNEITTNETSFFRKEKHFDWFRKKFVDEMISQTRRGNRKRQIRVLSAACSTGEEAYSLAICFFENQLRLKDWDLEIVGTDLDQHAIEKARQGVYKERAISNLDEKKRKRFFKETPNTEGWQIKESIRKMVKFQHHNLIHAWSGKQFDCVFLCNVLIYFDLESKQKVIGHLTRAIPRHGYLVLGPSEGVFDMLHGFSKLSTFLYQKQ